MGVHLALTDTSIRRAKPRQKPYKLFDDKGLYLHVHPNGSRRWRLKYYVLGKEKLMGLGVYPETSLKDAREKQAVARKLVQSNIDPVTARREEKRRAIQIAETTFEVIAKEWHNHQRGRWTPDHADRVWASLKKNVFPALGRTAVAEIRPHDVIGVIRHIEQREALDVAARVMQRTAAVLRYAVHTGRIEHNPAADLRGVLKTRKVQHRPAMNAEELPEFLRKLDEYKGEPITAIALRLLLLTFVRPGELRGARWKEFNLERAEWRIPAERMKMRQEHLVPMSHQAMKLLGDLVPISGGRELLFPSRNGQDKPMSENTLTFALYRMGYHKRATAHGFRATASTILNEQGFRPDVIERQLAHAERNKVRAAYHRSEYLGERKAMMQNWADFLDGVKTNDKVVSLKSGRRGR